MAALCGKGPTTPVEVVYDLDGDGAITREEWAGACAVFDALDVDGDGRVTPQELAAGRACAVCGRTYTQTQLPPPHRQMLLDPGVSFLAVAPRWGVALYDWTRASYRSHRNDVGKRVASLARGSPSGAMSQVRPLGKLFTIDAFKQAACCPWVECRIGIIHRHHNRD